MGQGIREFGDQLWREVFSRSPEDGFEGTVREQRQRFVTEVLQFLVSNEVEQTLETGKVLLALVKEALEMVALDNRWPSSEPDETARKLVAFYAQSEQSEERRRVIEGSLQALIIWTSQRSREEKETRPVLLRANDRIVQLILGELENELERVQTGEEARRKQLAVAITTNYTLIRDRLLRRKLIRLLEKLRDAYPATYADPFLMNYVVIYRNLRLEQIEREQEQKQRHR